MHYGDWVEDLIVGVLTGGVYNVAREVDASGRPKPTFQPLLGFNLEQCLRTAIERIRVGTIKDIRGAVRTYWGEVQVLSYVPLNGHTSDGDAVQRYPAIDPPTNYQSVALALLLKAFTGESGRQQAIAEYWSIFERDQVPVVSAKSRKYQDVMLQGVTFKTPTGNASYCTEYDFTDYDIWGAAYGLWHLNKPKYEGVFISTKGGEKVSGLAVEPPRMDFCGVGNAPFVGDKPLLVDGKPVMIGEGQVYVSDQGNDPHIVGGSPFCRYNPKNWVQEQFNELCFLLALSIFADKTVQALEAPNWSLVPGDPAYNAFMQTVALQHNFIMSKAGAKRDQWVTPVAGFHDNGMRYNDRRQYIIAKWRGGWNLQTDPQAYVYVPRGGSLERAFKKSDDSWRWGFAGSFIGVDGGGLTDTYAMGNIPNGLVEPPADFMCEFNATMMTVTMAVRAAMTIMQVGSGGEMSWLGGSFPTSNKGGAAQVDARKGEAFVKRIAQWVTGEVEESVKAGEIDITFADVDFTGASKAAGAIEGVGRTYIESFRPCVAKAEQKLWLGQDADRVGGARLIAARDLWLETARLWRSAAKQALTEASQIDPDQQAPTPATTPATTPVVAPVPSGGGLLPLLMGAGAGFLVGGPIGAGVGAVVAAAASGGARTSKPSEPAAVMSGRWLLKDSTGIVQLQQSGSTVTGGIAWSAGRGISLRGTRTGNTLEGTWADVSNKSNTGRFKLVFSGDTFTGPWGSGAASQGGGVWTGQRG